MGVSFHSTGCVKRAEECWNENCDINDGRRAAKTKEKPAGLNRRLSLFSRCERRAYVFNVAWLAGRLVVKFGPPANTFKMNSGDTSYIWQLGKQTNIDADRGRGIASTQYCKVNVIASKTGVVTQLNTEDSNAGAGLGSTLGMYGSICANRLGMERQS
jgi:hypothetical protein